MEKSDWGGVWAHFIGALGLPADATRTRQGEAWYAEFARYREGDLVRRAMRRVLDALEPGSSAFPDFAFARQHFIAEDRAESMLHRQPLAPCESCNGTGMLTLCAINGPGGPKWVEFEEYVDLHRSCVVRAPTATVRCRCPRGARFTAIPEAAGSPGKAIESYERRYGPPKAGDRAA